MPYHDGDHELEALFTLSLEMLCIAGVDGYFKRVNPAFERTLGYSAEELCSRPFVEYVHPDDREATRREIERLRSGQESVSYENRYQTRDGSYRWLSWTARPQGGRIYASATDVTERKRAEDRFRRLLESAPDAMVIVDQAGTIVLVNAQAERIFGWRRDELVGQSVELLVPGRLRGAHAAHRVAFAGHPHPKGMGDRPELSAVRKDGHEFPAEISLGPIQTDEGLLISCAIRDLTERKRNEKALRDREVQLLAAQRIQQYLLPRAPPALQGFDIAGAMHPAEFAAGDWFDYIPLPGNAVGIVIGDVAGHGFGAALLMASTHAHLRSFAQACDEVGEALTRTNRALAREIEPDRFLTLLLARLDPARRSIEYVNAGHPPGYVLDPQGRIKATLDSTELPLGVDEEVKYRSSGSLVLEPGDVVLLLTDGVLEAESPDGRPFGVDRALDVVRCHCDQSAAEMIDALYEAVLAHSARESQADDITTVMVKVDVDRTAKPYLRMCAGL